jgi:hypothetical protein
MTPDLQRIVEALKACRERYRISDFGPAGPYVLEENTSWDLAINLGEFVEKEDAQAYVDARCAEAMVRAIREPSTEMEVAGTEQWLCEAAMEDRSAINWRAMCDAILGETQP